MELWIEERATSVWHLATERLTPRSYRVACSVRMTRADARIYPRKLPEPGPPEAQRCHACAGARPVAIPIDVRVAVSRETA